MLLVFMFCLSRREGERVCVEVIADRLYGYIRQTTNNKITKFSRSSL
jgi:hypothetical protein